MLLAELLWNARVEGTLVDPEQVELPGDVPTAYAVQDAIGEIAEAEVIGFKLGATSEAALKALGIEQSFYGPMYAQYSHRSGDKVPLPTAHKILLETELAVGLGSDLPPRDAAYAEADVRAATAWIAPALELVATRLDIELAGNGVLLIADGGVNADFVLGERTDDLQRFDLTQHRAVLEINGKEAATGHTGMSIFGDPLSAGAWLANHSNLRSRGLKRGDVITTGTCTGMLPLATGDRAEADLGELGRVSMKLGSTR